jgi:hypothetical protein
LAEQLEVCKTRIGLGRQVIDTDAIAGVTATVTVVDPNFVASWTDVAVIVAFPVADAVKTPAGVIEPPVADQVTDGLYAPTPVTLDVQFEVCEIRIGLG